MKVSREAHAKINLFLSVGDRRPDGFHDILSVMHAVSLSDTVTLDIVRSSDSAISLVTDGDVPDGPSNLAWRACEAFLRKTGIDGYRIAIRLEKRVLDQIAEWKIGLAVLHASFEPVGEDERAVRLAIARDAVGELGDYARSLGITLAVEELPRTCLGNCSDEMLYLTDHGRLAKMTFDFNHLLRETHEHFLDACAPYIVTTHLSDYDFVDEKHWMPGVGKVDWPGVIRYIREKGYTGQFLFETYEQRAIPGRHCTPAMILETWRSMISD